MYIDPYTAKARAVFAFLRLSCPLCSCCLCRSWPGSQGVVIERGCLSQRSQFSHLNCLFANDLVIWGSLQSTTFSVHWGTPQVRVKGLEWEYCPPSPMPPWFQVGKCGLGISVCLMSKSYSILNYWWKAQEMKRQFGALLPSLRH